MHALSFTLEDQNGNLQSYQFPRPITTILCFGDMFSAPQLQTWVPPLYARFKNTIEIIGIATFGGVPSSLYQLVRFTIAKTSPKDVLIDWKGDVSNAYGATPGQCHIIMVGRGGDVRERVTGRATPETMQRLTLAIDRDLSTSLLPQ